MNPGPEKDGNIIAEAAKWHVASNGDAMDWDRFALWLEADSRHAQAYDEIALTEALLGDHRHNLSRGDVGYDRDTPSRKTSWRLAWGAVAAAVLAMVAIPAMRSGPDITYATTNAPRAIALTDGSMVTLAPHSQLSLSDRDTMRLTSGAWFDLRHIAGLKLAITAGQVTIRDIGTRFDVQAEGGTVSVAVAEGSVEVTSKGLSNPIALSEGRALLFDGDNNLARTSRIDPTSIGGWRQDRLSYENMPLPLVAADLGRHADAHLDVAANLRSRTFSGTLIIGKPHDAPHDLAQLMGLGLVRQSDGLRLDAGRGGVAN